MPKYALSILVSPPQILEADDEDATHPACRAEKKKLRALGYRIHTVTAHEVTDEEADSFFHADDAPGFATTVPE